MRLFLNYGGLMLVMILMLSGCAMLDTLSDDRAELGIKYSVMKTIEQSSDIEAVAVVEGADRALAVVDEDADVTVAGLAEQVRGEIRWGRLSLSDQMLLDRVLSNAEAELKAYVGDGVLDEDERVSVRQILGWVQEAAELKAAGE